jgi:hypothetical protein
VERAARRGKAQQTPPAGVVHERGGMPNHHQQRARARDGDVEALRAAKEAQLWRRHCAAVWGTS